MAAVKGQQRSGGGGWLTSSMRLRGRSRLSSTAASRAPWLKSEHSCCASAHRLGSARRSWMVRGLGWVARGCRRGSAFSQAAKHGETGDLGGSSLDPPPEVVPRGLSPWERQAAQSRQARPEEAREPTSGTANGRRLSMPPRGRVLLTHEAVLGELHAQQPRDHACNRTCCRLQPHAPAGCNPDNLPRLQPHAPGLQPCVCVGDGRARPGWRSRRR